VLDAVAGGSQAYSDGKRRLDIAILHYDQAVLDLTASVVADITFHLFYSYGTRLQVSARPLFEAKARQIVYEMIIALILGG